MLVVVTGTLVLCVVALGSAVSMIRWAAALDERRQHRMLRIDVETLRRSFSDEEASVRAFLLRGDDAALEPYDAARLVEARALGALENPVNETALADQLDDVLVAARRWQARAEERIEQRRTAGGAAAEAAAPSGFAALRTSMDRLTAAVQTEVQRGDRIAQHRQRVAALTLAGAFATVLLGLTAAVLLFHRWVTAPLALIGEAARAIGRGERTDLPRFEAVELDDVTGAIAFLERARAEERDRAVRAYQALEQSAVLALQVRAELADDRGAAPDGWTQSSWLRAAEGIVAGDCFDVGLVDDGRCAYLVVIDVTGHGAMAALTALKAKSTLRTALRAGVSPDVALDWLATHQAHEGGREYLTAFAAVVDLATGGCAYANAGHPPALVISDRRAAVELGATGPIIGPFRAVWQAGKAWLEPGESLVVYSDGLSEACGAQRERLGEERIAAALVSRELGDAGQIVELLVELYWEHRRGAGGLRFPDDDVTIVALRRDEADERSTTPSA